MAILAFPRHTRLTLLAGATLTLAACSFGPNGEPPAMPQPAHYGAEAQPTQTVPAQGVTQQFVVGAKPVPEWWKLYQSAALNSLVDEGLRNSPTLAATDKSLAAAREQLRAQIDTTERLVTLANDQARDTQRRYVLGAVSHVDQLSAQQSAASLSASLPGLKQQWLTTRHALAVLLGRTPDAAPDDLELAQLHVPEQVPVVVPSELLRTRPDIQAADAALEAAAADVGVATAQMFPSLSLSASMGQGGFSWPVALSGAGAIWSIGASLSQPLFHGGALFAQRRAAVDTYDATVSQYKQTVLTAFQNVADTLAALQHDAQALDAANIAARSAQGIFDETSGRYRLGALPIASTRSSEQQFRNAQLDEIRYTSARLTDTAALFQAMGNPPLEPGRSASASAAASAVPGVSTANVGASN